MHVEYHALEFTIFAAIAFCMLVIINSSHFVPYKTFKRCICDVQTIEIMIGHL